ncbi:hypothetical protein [Rhodoplanes sp. SY1]|uniref:hypothetical protein n=1 Tax=Rhodoplanes sp. SY1 TaxID=3166646 RepID=UPI0038B64F32
MQSVTNTASSSAVSASRSAATARRTRGAVAAGSPADDAVADGAFGITDASNGARGGAARLREPEYVAMVLGMQVLGMQVLEMQVLGGTGVQWLALSRLAELTPAARVRRNSHRRSRMRGSHADLPAAPVALPEPPAVAILGENRNAC